MASKSWRRSALQPQLNCIKISPPMLRFLPPSTWGYRRFSTAYSTATSNVLPQETRSPPCGSGHLQRSYHSTQFNNSRAAPKVTVPIDGKNIDFSALLLRDLCQCSSCIHPTTKQKMYSIADIPPDVNARTVEVSRADPQTVSISWDHDAPGFRAEHKTELSCNVLRDMDTSGVLPGPFRGSLGTHQLWKDASLSLPDIDFDAYMKHDGTLYQALRQLQDHGLLFVKNVPSVEKSVSMIAERIGPVKDTFYGHTWDVRSVPAAINAAYTSQDLGFHTDLLYTQNPPHIQLLHCVQSSSMGGASVFVDAYKAAVELFAIDRDAFDTLAGVPVNYHYNHPDANLYFATKPVLELRPLRIGNMTYDTLSKFLRASEEHRAQINQHRSANNLLPGLDVVDCIDKVNWGPPFLAPFSLQESSLEQASLSCESARVSLNQKLKEWHTAAQKFSELLHKPENLHERMMKPGECALFDNTGILHGRKAFDAEDAGKPRWLRGTYVDKDPYLSKLRVLQHKFENVHNAAPTRLLEADRLASTVPAV